MSILSASIRLIERKRRIVAGANGNRRLIKKYPMCDGWVVGNGDDTKWRMWADGMPIWTPDRDMATRYHRREDAEAVHAEDEGAWTVTPYNSKEQKDG